MGKELISGNTNLSWSASPIPFIDSIVLRSKNDVDKVIIQVYSQNGRLVKATNSNYTNGKINLNLSSL